MFQRTLTAIAIGSLAGLATAQSGAASPMTINEVLGSTTGADKEFIELYNTGAETIELDGWSIELWDSDNAAGFGQPDGQSPYVLQGSCPPRGFFTIANELAIDFYAFTPDQVFASNSIENGSYTIVLRDAGGVAVQTIFVTRSGDGDQANIAGTPVTPDATVGPDGSFLPAGFYRTTDGGPEFGLLDFALVDPPATPGRSNAGSAGACNAADLAEPWGELGMLDICAFLRAFLAQDVAADLAPPFAVWDLGDVVAFVDAFNTGCP
jgi:hypothetical protein